MPSFTALGGDLVQTALRDLDVERKARDAGFRKDPPVDSTTLDATHQEILAYFSNKLRDRRSHCENELNALKVDRQTTSAKINVEQTKYAFSNLANSINPEVQSLQQKNRADVLQANDEVDAALTYLRGFQQEHRLFNKPAFYPDSRINHFAVVALIAVLEWVALAAFYAEGSDFGLIGGVLIAMALSVANISLAILTGSLLRYLNHKSIVRKFLAVIGVLVMVVLFAVVTLGAAHYRVATNEIAASHTTGKPESAAQGRNTLTSSLRTDTSESEQWRAAKLAGKRLATEPFGFEDVFSWILLVLAIVFGIFATYKGYRIDDAYPGYGDRDRSYRQHTRQYNERKQLYVEEVKQFFGHTLNQQGSLLSQVRRDIDYYLRKCSDSLEKAQGFENVCNELRDACNVVVQTYREVNTQVAGPPRPSYYDRPVQIEPRLLAPLEALTEEERALQQRYANAIREFLELAQHDNKIVQDRFAEELKRLEEFFVELESNIRERLRQEAAYIAGSQQ